MRHPTPSTPTAIDGLRVLVVDDSLFIREGLTRVLGARGAVVVGQAGDPVQAMIALEHTRADVAILDVRMPPSFTNEGILAAEQIRLHHPGVGILMLAQDAEMRHVERLLNRHERGIGYLLKDRVSDWAQLAAALGQISAGGAAVDPSVVDLLVRSRRRSSAEDPLSSLTDRELTVLAMMAEGLTNAAIADRLTVGGRTVETHVKAVFDKLGFQPGPVEHRRVLAVVEYLRLRPAAPIDATVAAAAELKPAAPA